MKNTIIIVGFSLLLIVANSVWADETNVSPGIGTLQAAIDAAAWGDTLILQEGGYEGLTTINKSLTIRPVNRATNAVITSRMNIDATSIEVTVQGLIFSADLYVIRGTSVRILENEWSSGDIVTSFYSTSDGDGSLVIVGNIIANGNISEINAEGAYVAGNLLYQGVIRADAYVWIIGNQVLEGSGSNAIYTEGSVANIIANRVNCSYQTYINCIHSSSSSSFIAGNIVKVNDSGPSEYEQRGIYVDFGNATIINNVIQGTPSGATRTGSAISEEASIAEISGNIIIDYQSNNSGFSITSTAPTSEVSYNLCFNNSGDCPPGDGNLNVDPMFVDLVEYRLSPASPAVDTGPPDYGMADLDRSRNDIGAHGGPWSIGQYDVQRDPDNFAPFVYPLFKSESFISGGILEVQALGVARLR